MSIFRRTARARTALLLFAVSGAILLPGRVSAQCPASQALVIQVGPAGIGELTSVNLDSGVSTDLTGAFQNAQFVALNSTETTAFVTDALGGTLARVDLATGDIRIVASGLSSPRGVALNSGEDAAYVAEWSSGRILSVNLATGSVTTLAGGLPGPIGLTLNAGRTAAYVSAQDLYRVDLASGDVSMVAPMPGPGLGMLGVALDASETTAYVTVPNDGELLAVDLARGQVRRVAAGLDVPFGVTLDSAGRVALVTDPFAFRLIAVDLDSGESAPVATGIAAVGTVLNSAGTEALVAGGATLTSVNLFTGGTRVVAAGLITPGGMALSPGEGKVYLADFGHLRVFDRAAGTLSTVAEGFDGLQGVALNLQGTLAYATEGGRLISVDLHSGAVAEVAAGLLSPGGVASDPSGGKVWVTENDEDTETGSLASVDLATGAVTPVTRQLSSPRSLALDAAGTAAYVTGKGTLWRVALPSGSTELLVSDLDSPLGKVGGVALDSEGTVAYVTEAGNGRLSSVDLGSRQVASVAVGLQQPAAVAITTSGASADRPPVAVARIQPSFPCTSPAGGAVALDGTASWDPDSSHGTSDDIVSYDWYEHFGQPGQILLGRGAFQDSIRPLGAHDITLVVTDRCGRSDHQTALTEVDDRVPPVIALWVTPGLLWPPNHRLVPVEVAGSARDECGPASLVLESVVSSEPDDADGSGDGATLRDIRGAEPGTADFQFQVRAERAAEGTGRTYTVIYRATDASGNVATASSTLLVPHDRDGGEEPITIQVDESASGTVLAWTTAPGAISYDVVRGRVASLVETVDGFQLGPLTWLASATPLATTRGAEDAEIPPPGEAFFYLVQYREGEPSGFGTASAAQPRIPEAAPGGATGTGSRRVTR